MQINSMLSEFTQEQLDTKKITIGQVEIQQWTITDVMRGTCYRSMQYGSAQDTPVVISLADMTCPTRDRHSKCTLLYGNEDKCDEIATKIISHFPSNTTSNNLVGAKFTRYIVYNTLTKQARNYTRLEIDGEEAVTFGTKAQAPAEEQVEVAQQVLIIQLGSTQRTPPNYKETQLTNIFRVDDEGQLQPYVLQYNPHETQPFRIARLVGEEINDPTAGGIDYPWARSAPDQPIDPYTVNNGQDCPWRTSVVEFAKIAQSTIDAVVAAVNLLNNKAVLL